MTSPPRSPGTAAWRQEAEAVVVDIAPHVSVAAVSALSGDSASALLNITTLEGRRLTVRLTAAGFSVCGEGHDSCSSGGSRGERVYETPYALLHDLSPAYTTAFGRSLAERLGRLADDVEGEERQLDGGEGEVQSKETARSACGGVETGRKGEPSTVSAPQHGGS